MTSVNSINAGCIGAHFAPSNAVAMPPGPETIASNAVQQTHRLVHISQHVVQPRMTFLVMASLSKPETNCIGMFPLVGRWVVPLSVSLSLLFLFPYLSIYLSVYLSIYLSIFPSPSI